MTTTQYPFLTYGTLRPTQYNYELLAGTTKYEADVTVTGYDMYVFHGYPYVIDGTDTIKATLNFVESYFYDDVMHDLDTLEGFRGEGNPYNHYDRILTDVEFAGTTIKAWMYVARNELIVSRAKELMYWESGDWVEFAELLRMSTYA